MENIIDLILENNFGYEIAEADVQRAREVGARIHAFWRHEDDEELTYYAAMPRVVERYHASGGLWAYIS